MAISNEERSRRLGKYLEKKFLEYINKEGRMVNQTEFARVIGISPASLSQYMKGYTRIPDKHNMTKLALSLGPEIYEVLDIEPGTDDDPRVLLIVEIFNRSSSEVREKILQAIIDLSSKQA